MGQPEEQRNRFHHVHRYLTPLAMAVVVPGLLFAPLEPARRWGAAALLAYSLAVNFLSHRWSTGDAAAIGKLRVISNYITNIGLVCLMYAGWPAVWILLLMMSIGPAIYQNRKDALNSSLAVAFMMVAAQAGFGEYRLAAWAQALVQSAAIVLLGLFVNGLASRGPGASEGV